MQIEPKLLAQIRDVIGKNTSVTSAVLFGSRAMNTASLNSDIDIALKGSVSALTAESISQELEDTVPTLRQFDVVSYENITLPALVSHIDRVGITFFQKGECSHSPSPNTARE